MKDENKRAVEMNEQAVEMNGQMEEVNEVIGGNDQGNEGKKEEMNEVAEQVRQSVIERGQGTSPTFEVYE